MARINYVEPETASQEVREVLERLPAKLNIFRVMAHAETNLKPLLRLGTSILGQQRLSAKLRELAILRVAKLSQAPYEWVQHVPIGLAVGMTQAQVDALDRGDSAATCFDEIDALVLRFTDEVVRDVGCSDATFAAIAAKLSTQELVELVLAIGFYMTMARLMETFQIDIEPAAGGKIIAALKP